MIERESLVERPFKPVVCSRIDIDSVVEGRKEQVWTIRPAIWTSEQTVVAFNRKYPNPYRPDHPFPIGETVELEPEDLQREVVSKPKVKNPRGRPGNPVLYLKGKALSPKEAEKQRKRQRDYYQAHKDQFKVYQKEYNKRKKGREELEDAEYRLG